jgi:hypothetical protein
MLDRNGGVHPQKPDGPPSTKHGIRPEISLARDLINDARHKGIDAVVPALIELNTKHPGIMTLAICHDDLTARNIGSAFGCYLPWVPVVGTDTCRRLHSYKCTEISEDWRESLSSEQRASVTGVVDSFIETITSSGKMFKDNPKIHLEGVSEEGDTLSFVTRPARYAENAAISLSMGNALYELSKIGPIPHMVERDEKNVRQVLTLLAELNLEVGERGIDFSLGKSKLPHTLGVGGVLITQDGYLIQALQGNKNMTSGGDFVPAISGSADPRPGTKSLFDPIADFSREKKEEQGNSPLSFLGISGVYQSLHRLGKPEVFLVGVLKDTLVEFLQKQALATDAPRSWELKVTMANATKVLDLQNGFNPSLGDDLRPSDRVVGTLQSSPGSEVAGTMQRGELTCQLEPPGKAALLAHIRSGGLENHVNQAALAAALQYLEHSQKK